MQIETSQLNPYGKIYRLTDTTNGKMYHGQTTEKDINDRWYRYKRIYCKTQPKLYHALKKHGPENFLFEVIDSTPQNQPQLDNLEIYYIAKFDSMRNGYNCDPGGRGTGHRSEETKRKISKSLSGNNNPMFGKHYKSPFLGKSHCNEAILKNSESHKGTKNFMYGKKVSEEVKNKIRESLRLTREAKKLQNIT